MKRNMKDVGIGAGVWYEKAQDRREWYEAYSEGAQHQTQQKRLRHQEERTIECAVRRRREADKARHKCSTERAKPVDEQRGSVKCDACGRWFRRWSSCPQMFARGGKPGAECSSGSGLWGMWQELQELDQGI